MYNLFNEDGVFALCNPGDSYEDPVVWKNNYDAEDSRKYLEGRDEFKVREVEI